MLPVIDYMGVTSLGVYFTSVSWILLAVSSLILFGMFAMSFKGWSKIEAGLREPQMPIIQIEQSQGLLKRFGVLAS